MKKGQVTKDLLQKVNCLNDIALKRGQSLAQMAISWLLKDHRITSVLVGVSKVQQLLENIDALKRIDFSEHELMEIENILSS